MKGMLLRFAILGGYLALIALPVFLAGCSEKVLEPIEIDRKLPRKPKECTTPPPEALPAIGDLPTDQPVTPEDVAAHAGQHMLEVGKVYRERARDPLIICQRYVARLHATQPKGH